MYIYSDLNLYPLLYSYHFKNFSPNDQCTKGCKCGTLNSISVNKTIDCQQATQEEMFAYVSTQYYC